MTFWTLTALFARSFGLGPTFFLARSYSSSADRIGTGFLGMSIGRGSLVISSRQLRWPALKNAFPSPLPVPKSCCWVYGVIVALVPFQLYIPSMKALLPVGHES